GSTTPRDQLGGGSRLRRAARSRTCEAPRAGDGWSRERGPVIGPMATRSWGERTTLGVVRGGPARGLRGNLGVPWLEAVHRSRTHPPAVAEVFVVAFENARMVRPGDASLSAVRDRGGPDSGAGLGIA